MSEDQRKSRNIPWAEVEREYVETGVKQADLARKYGCSEEIIRRKKKAGSWDVKRDAFVRGAGRGDPNEPQRTPTGGVGPQQRPHLIALPGGVEGESSSRGSSEYQQPGDGADPAQFTHERLSKAMVAAATLGLEYLVQTAATGRMSARSFSETLKNVVLSGGEALDKDRLVNGQRPGEPSTSKDATEKTPRIVRRVIVRPPVEGVAAERTA